MSRDIRQYSDEVWDRFFEFVFPCEAIKTREEVDAELQRRGIDVRPAIRRVKEALEARKAREALQAARRSRVTLMSKLDDVTAPNGQALRVSLQQIISQLAGIEQAAYYHKLEKAATEADLQSLLEDLHRLDAIERDEDDGRGSGQ